MIHEQFTLTGDLELTDSLTMKVLARKLIFTAIRPCVLCGERFTLGEQIEAIFPAHVDLAEGHGSGPWSPGGRSSRWLKAHASQILEAGRRKVFFSKGESFVS
jgi:hypothetical protein